MPQTPVTNGSLLNHNTNSADVAFTPNNYMPNSGPGFAPNPNISPGFSPIPPITNPSNQALGYGNHLQSISGQQLHFPQYAIFTDAKSIVQDSFNKENIETIVTKAVVAAIKTVLPEILEVKKGINRKRNVIDELDEESGSKVSLV